MPRYGITSPPYSPASNWQGDLEPFLIPPHPLGDHIEDLSTVLTNMCRSFVWTRESNITISDTLSFLSDLKNRYGILDDRLGRIGWHRDKLHTVHDIASSVMTDCNWLDNDLDIAPDGINRIRLEANRNLGLLAVTNNRIDAEKDNLQNQWACLKIRLEEVLDETPTFIHDHASDSDDEERGRRASHWASRWPSTSGH